MKQSLFTTLTFVFCYTIVLAQSTFDKENSIKSEGFFNYYYNTEKDKLYLEVDRLDEEFLYVYSLSSGIGSNDLGLDRGQIGNEQVVIFKKTGNKLLLLQPNMKFRAETTNTLEQLSVKQAFAKSVLFGATILEEKGGRYIIDITDFLMRDAHGVSSRLKGMEQGSYKLDKSRSAFNMNRTKAFPENIEFDIWLTFKGDPKGELIRSVTPDPQLVTVAQHHSFIALPKNRYEKRAFDPRSGSYPYSYYDYASPVEEPIVKRYINRHRLVKKDPSASLSEAEEPIVYYLDNGTPEPVRTALLEGARWWNQAFEANGYRNAFQVKILPDDADPLDIRYNVIQWVHRSTRGWSYGNSVIDPRTGEILKGHVSLGSLRIRQDFMIAQALSDAPFAERDENHDQMLELALARIRQLSAHEVGHTLGFAHNFAASTNNRASVMDYPHPKIELVGDQIDFSKAYDEGIGEWDKVSVAYSYSDFQEGTDEQEALNNILENAYESGLQYMSDQDARPKGGAHAKAHLWDNGTSPSEELNRVLAVREKAIDNFSIDNIRTNEPMTVLEDVFVPLYLFHRYQTEAAVKLVGGLDYHYSVKGDNLPEHSMVSKKEQEKALLAVLKTVDAAVIAIPKEKLSLFAPRAIGYERTRESFKGYTGTAFDPIGAAQTAADLSLGLLFHPERASRLIQQQSISKKQFGLEEALDMIFRETLMKSHKDAYLSNVQSAINYRVLDHLISLGATKNTNPRVRAICHLKLKQLSSEWTGMEVTPDQAEMIRIINSYFKEPASFNIISTPKIPDGSPIGMDCQF
ncbi:MAG: zinc-dependent metalloprotease [Flavobacteriaceae bacterium]